MYSGAEWIKNNLKTEMSPLGETVANLLGHVFLGIYHLHTGALRNVDWSNNHHIQFIYRGELATFDFNSLTALVVFAHDEMMRVSIEGCGPDYMRLMFHQRKSRTGSICEKCPTIEKHIKILRCTKKSV